MIRPTTLLFRGKFSSMLDMGGVGQAAVTKKINVGKNNKVRAICLDFNLITRSIEERRVQAEEEDRIQTKIDLSKSGGTQLIHADTSAVQSFANLLGVKLGDSISQKKKDEDDLSGLLGNICNSEPKKPKITAKKIPTSSSHTDIRSKYSQKLRNKIEGGVAGLDLAKSEKEDNLNKGDAAMHLAARNLMSVEGAAGAPSRSSSRWLATTGVGKLLSFVDGRSMQIVLLPLPSTPSMPQSDEDVKHTLEEMTNLTKQLPNVNFDLLVSDGRRKGTEDQNDDTAQYLVKNVLSKLDSIDPIQFLLVSDRDDLLGAARDLGMFTVRVRPKNRRRGLTTNYNVDDVGSVQEVINEINGVSFNSALKAK